MPADKEKVGTGRRRQSGATDPDRMDDSRKAKERAIDKEAELEAQAEDLEHERGWQPGATAPGGPHRRPKPGTRRDIEEAGLNENIED